MGKISVHMLGICLLFLTFLGTGGFLPKVTGAESETRLFKEFTFKDTDPDRDEYEGFITWQAPEDEGGIDHYLLEGSTLDEYGNNVNFQIAEIRASGKKRYSFQFHQNTRFAEKVAAFEITAFDVNGNFVSGSYLTLIDNCSAEEVRQSSLQSNTTVRQIKVNANREKFLVSIVGGSLAGIEGYVLYFLDKNQQKISQIGEVIPQSLNSIWLNKNEIPEAAVSIGVFPRSSSGEGEPEIARIWNDALHIPTSVSFSDNDPRIGRISGLLTFSGASDETDDIVGYEVGFLVENHDFIKIGEVDKSRNETYSFIVPDNTSVPMEASLIAVRIKHDKPAPFDADYLIESQNVGVASEPISSENINIVSRNNGQEVYLRIKEFRNGDLMKVYDKENKMIFSHYMANDPNDIFRILLENPEGKLYVTKTKKGYKESPRTEISYHLPNDIQFETNLQNIPFVQQVFDTDKQVTGVVFPYSEVDITANGQIIGTALANESGSFSATVPQQTGGSLIKVVQKHEGLETETSLIVEDTTYPTFSLKGQVTNETPFIYGKTKKYAQVSISNGEDTIVSKQADFNGDFYAEMPVPYDRKTFFVKVIDQSGKQSTTYSFNVLDVIPPEAPSIHQVTDQSKRITGTAEPNAKILARYGTTIEEAMANHVGLFWIDIPKMKAGTSLYITAIDEDGNVSKEVMTTVIDITGPEAPTVTPITDQSTMINGKSEGNSSITIKYGTVVKNILSDAKGNFSLSIPKQKAGTAIFVKATDNAGNTSKETKLSVKDVTPPNQPTVNQVTNVSTAIQGKAEPGSTVTVYIGKKLVGKSITTSKGTYSIKIAKQKEDSLLLIYAIDKAGNKSKAKQTTIIDKIPPTVPKVNPITTKTITITGKTEKYATVTITNQAKKVIGKAKADRYGNFKVKVSKQKKGTTLTICSIDKAGNKSKGKGVKVV